MRMTREQMMALTGAQERQDVLNMLATLCAADAEEHQLFDECIGLDHLEARKRMTLRICQ